MHAILPSDTTEFQKFFERLKNGQQIPDSVYEIFLGEVPKSADYTTSDEATIIEYVDIILENLYGVLISKVLYEGYETGTTMLYIFDRNGNKLSEFAYCEDSMYEFGGTTIESEITKDTQIVSTIQKCKLIHNNSQLTHFFQSV